MVIYFDETKYYKAIDKINQIIAVINQFNGEITNENLQQLRCGNYYKNCWLNKLKEYCEKEYLDFETISTIEYRVNNPSINERITRMCKVNKEIDRQIKFVAGYEDKYLFDYITIKDNKAVLITEAYKLIKERFTHYTQNDKQKDVTKLVNQMQTIYKELAKLGLERYKIDKMVNRYDYDIINWQLIQSL